jgi:dTDP-glucose 4,6-dehydratase
MRSLMRAIEPISMQYREINGSSSFMATSAMPGWFRRHDFDFVVYFAAESHVDRSIVSSGAFVRTNVVGTHTLFDCALNAWKSSSAGRRFHHVSTDEVFGSLAPDDPPFTETSRYDPRSPYTAVKRAAIFWSVPMRTPMVCRQRSPTVPTTTVRTNSRKNSFR